MQAGQDIQIGARLTQTEYQYTLSDTDTDELNHWAPIIQQAMEKMPALQDVATDQQIAAPHVAVDIDRNTAYRLGLSLSQIDETLYDAFGQRQVAPIYTSTNQYSIVLEVEPQFQRDPDALSNIYLTSSAGTQVPLSAVAHFVDKVEPLTVNHQGQFPVGDALLQRFARRLAGPSGRSDTSDAAPAPRAGDAPGLLPGYGAGLPVVALVDAAAGAAAIFVVYIVLGMLYESYIHPITILSALPSAGVGALLMLMLFHYDLSIIAIDRHHPADRHRQEERDHDDRLRARGRAQRGQEPASRSIHEACLLRFRPIMMTTIGGALRRPCRWRSAWAPAPSCAGRSASPSSAACWSRSC